MRDIERIDHLMKDLQELWENYPDTRLGQLLLILQSKYSKVPDLFHLEDSELQEILTKIDGDIHAE